MCKFWMLPERNECGCLCCKLLIWMQIWWQEFKKPYCSFLYWSWLSRMHFGELTRSQQEGREVGSRQHLWLCGCLHTQWERSSSGTDPKSSMSRPSAEVPKCSLGNMFLQCCNILTCLLPFPFPSPSHGCPLLRNLVAARTEMSFSSHNLHNWSSWKVTQHFCFLPHLMERLPLMLPKVQYLAESSWGGVLP